MTTPANRVPVRIARGSKANLDIAIAAGDLKEGEICYAEDENGIYVVEGGTLTQAGADLASTSIDALTDVDTTTAAPTDGQALVWDNAAGQWEPGTVATDTAIEWTLTANGTTDYIFAGAGFAGTETDPDLYVVRGQTYKIVNEMGAHPFQIQSTQGIGGTAYNDGITNNAVSNDTLTWEVRMDAPSTLYYQCTSHADMSGTITVINGGNPSGIDDLSDVDTSTVAPTDGQALVWDSANSKWEPGTVSGGGSVSRVSVNNTTASIAHGVAADMTIAGTGKAGQLFSIETSHAAWVTVYASQSARTADAARSETTDPSPGSGVLAEVVTTGAQAVLITPCVNHFNDETVPADELYLKVVNKAGSAQAITVTLKVLPLE